MNPGGLPSTIIDAPTRFFHVETLKGGMNRLLLRANRSESEPTRLEVLFMNVRFLCIGTTFEGLTITETRRQDVQAALPVDWNVPDAAAIRWFSVTSRSGSGLILAGGVDTDESDAGPAEPSRFFMME